VLPLFDWINTAKIQLEQRRHELERPFLPLGAVSIISFVVVGGLVFSHLTQTVDAQLALSINQAYLGSAISALMVLAAEYGREHFWIPVVAVMLIVGDRRTKFLAMELAILFLVGIAVGETLKIVAFRARPFVGIEAITTRVPTDFDSSFPSGHVLIVAIGSAFSLLKFRKREASLLLSLEAAIVCYSRVYVGMHYPLDVVAGVLLGIGIVGIGLSLLEGSMEAPLMKISSQVTGWLKEGPLKL
jgi:undecaprenyl-diphosphatase